MGDFFGKFAEEILNSIKKNYKRPKLWIGGFCLIFIFVLLIPYIDANFFYFSRMDKRIEILDKVMNLDMNKVESNNIFKQEYQSLLNEITQNREHSLNTAINEFINLLSGTTNKTGNNIIKFITGSIWLIILLVCIPFMNTFKRKKDKLIAFVLIAVMTVLFGLIFMSIPIIISPFINYVVFPTAQFILFVFLLIKYNNKKKDK